jgi:hypothetical protein
MTLDWIRWLGEGDEEKHKFSLSEGVFFVYSLMEDGNCILRAFVR